MDQRIPHAVRPLLDAYVQRLSMELSGLIAGVYVHGSLAYDAFNEQTSDIDILSVTHRTCTAEELSKLKNMHTELKEAWPGWRLEVSYVPQAECALAAQPGRSKHAFHQDGEFVDSGIFDFNSPLWAPMLWWQVKTRAIVLAGPEPDALGIPVTSEDIVETSRQLTETYWPQWIDPRENLFKLRHTLHVDWVIFGMLRTLFTLRERDIASKSGATSYGLLHLPKRWHWLIRENIRQRQRDRDRSIPGRLFFGIATAVFLRYMLSECRRLAMLDPVT